MNTSNGVKRTLFVLGLSTVLVLVAGQALAVAYAPAAGSMMNSGQSGTVITTSPSGTQVWGQTGQGNMMYRTMPGSQTLSASTMTAGAYAGRQAVWFGLVSVITTVLVWIVLIQLIFVLAHWLKKHKHN